MGTSAEKGPSDIKDFIARWAASGARERANYQLFLSELCDVLGVPRLRAMWFVAAGEVAPRLVTTYPIGEGEE